MGTLYLLRHAKSSWNDPSQNDFDRPLNARGKAARMLIRTWLKQNGVRPGLILCSPAVRTRETLEPLLDLWNPVPEIRYEARIYEAATHSLKDVLRSAAADARSILMIGHNPGTQRLALDLADGAPSKYLDRLQEKVPTATLIRLDADGNAWARMESGAFRLGDFVVARELENA